MGIKKGKKSKIVSFDEEVVTKSQADQLLQNEPKTSPTKLIAEQKPTASILVKPTKKKGQKRPQTAKPEHKEPPKKPKKQNDEETELEIELEESRKEMSKRAQKRIKYAQLLDEKKTASLLNMQQRALNYLSQWKHNREGWKFQKNTQVWLQQNLFKVERVPQEIWGCLVEYISKTKGQARDLLVKQAVEIIEKDSKTEEEAEKQQDEETYKIVLERARDVVQHLQE